MWSTDAKTDLLRGLQCRRLHRADGWLDRFLSAEPGKDIWLCGDAQLAGAVFSEIDELILKINPDVASNLTTQRNRNREVLVQLLSGLLMTFMLSLAACLPVACAREQSDAERAKAVQREIIEELRQRFPQHSFKPSDDGLALLMEDGTQLGLTNLRAQLDAAAPQTAEERRTAIATHFARTLAQLADTDSPDWATAKPLIRPLLIPLGHPVAKTVLTRAFAADIALAFVIDRPKSMMYISEDMRRKWNCSLDDLHALAIANLDAVSANDSLQVSERKRAGGTDRLLVVRSDDGYAAARLASPAFRRRLTDALGGSFMAGVPNRDFLIAWTRDNPEHAELAKRVEEDAQKYPYPISSTLLVVANGEVRPAARP
jgi:uncharacterized protein YtpQ (UPF0354 family)